MKACVVSHRVVLSRANGIQKAERLNHARSLLQRFDHLPDAVERMVLDCGVSRRQAYRYVEHARGLKQAVLVGEAKIAFTVKLPLGLVERLRSYASATGVSLSEIASQALESLLRRRRPRG